MEKKAKATRTKARVAKRATGGAAATATPPPGEGSVAFAPPPTDLPGDPMVTYDPYMTFGSAPRAAEGNGFEPDEMGADADDGGGEGLPYQATMIFGSGVIAFESGADAEVTMDRASSEQASRGGTKGSRRKTGAASATVEGEVAPAGAQWPAARPLAGQFELKRKIAEGGFGEIWEAEQRALGRTVAVKRLRPGAALPGRPRENIARFRQEALTAAHLEHPNIVPVYDLGTDAAGRPLLAMKLVHGREWRAVMTEDFSTMPVQEYLARHLPHLIAVGQAVAFAHAHGIIHRDLKPVQVMIGRYGEVLLMDWGLAMPFAIREEQARAEEPTGEGEALKDGSNGNAEMRAARTSQSSQDAGEQKSEGRAEKFSSSGPRADRKNDPNATVGSSRHGSVRHAPMNPAGTPAYMAPEQTEETTANLGPWTDVYLLGGILFELLTGRCPHWAEDSAQTYLLAQEGVVQAPEKVAPAGREIPPELSSLALHAMAKRPQDRVSSAEAFVAALQDYLSGAGKRRESVQLTDRVASSLADATTDYARLADCLNRLDRALVLWPDNIEAARLRQRALMMHARAAVSSRDLKLARVQAERLDPGVVREALLLEIGEREKQQAQQDQTLAEALARAKADRDRAESLVRFLIGDLHRALKPSGRLDLLRRVTRETLNYFDELSEGEETDQTLHNRATAFLNIGDVLSDEGKKNEAGDAYAKARQVALQLAQRDPRSPAWQLTLADSHDRLGQIDYYQGRAEESLQDHTAALTIREAVLRHLTASTPSPEADTPAPPDMAARLLEISRVEAGIASSRHKIGVVLWRQQDLARSLQHHLDALKIFRRLAAREPNDESHQSAVTYCLSTLANVYRDLANLDEAIEVTREALTAREELSQAAPADIGRLDDVMWSRSNLGHLYVLKGELEEALSLFQRDMPVRRRLAREDPNNVVRLFSITFPLSIAADILFVLGRIDDAERTVSECLDASATLLQKDPTSTQVLGAYALQMAQLGEIVASQSHWMEAEDLARRGLELARRAAVLAPRNALFAKAQAKNLILLGRSLTAPRSDLRTPEEQRQAEAQKMWAEARQLLAAAYAESDNVAVLDLKAQLLLLLGEDPEQCQQLIEQLRKRRWVSPYLKMLQKQCGAAAGEQDGAAFIGEEI